MMLSLDLSKPIQVRTGDFRRTWMDANVVAVFVETVGQDENGKDVHGLSFSVEFADGATQRVTDAFGWSSDDWRYKERCCEQCRWHSIEGGDTVPYGATTANLPEGYICNCPDMPEDMEDPYSETDGGKTCQHHAYEQ